MADRSANPLVESSNTIIVSLKKYQKNLTDLQALIQKQRKDKKLLEDSLVQLAEKQESIEESLQEMRAKRERLLVIVQQIEGVKARLGEEYFLVLNKLRQETNDI